MNRVTIVNICALTDEYFREKYAFKPKKLKIYQQNFNECGKCQFPSVTKKSKCHFQKIK